jgi:hypothetical protein
VTTEIEELKSQEEKEKYLKNYMLVNVMSLQEKKHRCYHYLQMIDNLKERPAEELAVAMKSKPENLGCTTAYELLFKAHSRFSSIKSFRECLMSRMEEIDIIQNSPIMFLEPAKIMSHRKFKYSLD